MSEKLCVFCEHWEFDGGEQGYSEMTPGTNASMGCKKEHWDGKRMVDIWSEVDFRKIILTAKDCKDYEIADE